MTKKLLVSVIGLLVFGISACASAKLTAPEKLPNSASLKRGMTENEFMQAYKIAAKLMSPYAGLSLEKKLESVTKGLYQYMRASKVGYSDTAPHYNDVYGFFVNHVSSCAGATRAVGLCLNILGIPYTHVNENEWSHQWCRVKVGRNTWACDIYMPRYGQEGKDQYWAVTTSSGVEWKLAKSRIF
ncbi:MAG: hypothetical protein LBC99_07560 [Spirochaetota bacterium]|jgi:hypothetical protein|nr:hypothetical protein [Spirochaetota bacterium]